MIKRIGKMRREEEDARAAGSHGKNHGNQFLKFTETKRVLM